MLPPSLLLLRVAAAWPLPGLGLLALPDGAAPHLTPFPLHTALPVAAVLPDGARYPGIATIEEVTRPDTAPVRGLLLDLAPGVALPPGTEIWGQEALPDSL